MKSRQTGSCQCGAVTYELAGEALTVYACHCTDCQKRTGSAFSMALVIAANEMELKGDLVAWERISAQGNVNARYSCRACGNVIYGIGSDSPNFMKLQAGTLDGTEDLEPEVHIWVRSAQSWVRLQEGVPQYPTQPEDMSEALVAAIEYRNGSA